MNQIKKYWKNIISNLLSFFFFHYGVVLTVDILYIKYVDNKIVEFILKLHLALIHNQTEMYFEFLWLFKHCKYLIKFQIASVGKNASFCQNIIHIDLKESCVFPYGFNSEGLTYKVLLWSLKTHSFLWYISYNQTT